MNPDLFTSLGVRGRSPRVIFLALCWMLFFGLCAPAHSKRIALVIGNDAYENVTKLQKAGNDASAMARELTAAGFEVQLHRDVNYRNMVKAVETLSKRITGGDEVVVFFAGHGVQIKTGSFMLPIDIEATSESEVEKTAYGVNDLTEKLSEAKAAFTLVMVDACRDNPLKAAGRSVGNSRGLSAIEPPKGQMVVYSASRGQQALDRLNEKDPNPNGVFTREFIARMRKPGVKIEDLVREVQDSVETLAQTVKHEQRPAIYNEARGNFYFFGPTTVMVGPQAPAKPEAVAPSVRPGQVQGLSLADLEREEATRKEWADWQGRMKADFDKTAAFAGSADLMAKAWDRFLVVWAQDNPMSTQDEALRAQAAAKRDVARQASAQAPQVVAQPAAASGTGQIIKDCADCPEMVVIPAGSFTMGSSDEEQALANEGGPAATVTSRESPQHSVNIRSFVAARYAITKGEFAAFVRARGYQTEAEQGDGCRVWNGKELKNDKAADWRYVRFTQTDSHPVVCVSWNDAQAYIGWLNQTTGKTFRLLSESEREYVARAGTQTAFWWGDSITTAQANYGGTGKSYNGSPKGEYRQATVPVSSFAPNPFGLYNVHGNVSEWAEDCSHDTYSGAPADGSAWTTGCSGNYRVLRGGAWRSVSAILRSALRSRNAPDYRSYDVGFRLARSP